MLLVVDGSIPTGAGGAYSTIAGESNLALLARSIEAAEVVIAVGTCAAFGGLPAAAPNPTGAMAVGELVERGLISRRPLINVPGCPPIPVVLSAVLVHLVAFGRGPELDELGRPRAFYGNTIHDRCSRRGFFEEGLFARTFDDEGARNDWCLLELGCKGPITRNACAMLKWNDGVSNPIESGHPCLGCSEPRFWGQGSFYRPLAPEALDDTAANGAAIYDGNCVYCHSADPARLKTPPEQVPALLRSGTVRAHGFELGEDQLRALVNYLKEHRR